MTISCLTTAIYIKPKQFATKLRNLQSNLPMGECQIHQNDGINN